MSETTALTRQETMRKVYELMDKADGRRLFITNGPNENSEFEGWVVGDRIVIMQIWKEGGCDHYVQGRGTLWDQLEGDLMNLVQERQQRLRNEPWNAQ
jgi:hypothetical protein